MKANWAQFVVICGKIYWKMNEVFPYKVIHCERKLPSDSVFRKDLICRCLGNDTEG